VRTTAQSTRIAAGVPPLDLSRNFVAASTHADKLGFSSCDATFHVPFGDTM
jgi:hypothetical protein